MNEQPDNRFSDEKVRCARCGTLCKPLAVGYDWPEAIEFSGWSFRERNRSTAEQPDNRVMDFACGCGNRFRAEIKDGLE